MVQIFIRSKGRFRTRGEMENIFLRVMETCKSKFLEWGIDIECICGEAPPLAQVVLDSAEDKLGVSSSP